MRILLFVKPSIATSTALTSPPVILCGRYCGRHFSFHRYTNGPDETEQLATDCGHDLLLILSACQKFLISHVKSVLRFPRYFSHFGN